MKARDRIVEVLAKYSVTLEDAPLDALTMAMERMHTSLLRPPVETHQIDISTPEGAAKVRADADYYRNVLKPFA